MYISKTMHNFSHITYRSKVCSLLRVISALFVPKFIRSEATTFHGNKYVLTWSKFEEGTRSAKKVNCGHSGVWIVIGFVFWVLDKTWNRHCRSCSGCLASIRGQSVSSHKRQMNAHALHTGIHASAITQPKFRYLFQGSILKAMKQISVYPYTTSNVYSILSMWFSSNKV